MELTAKLADLIPSSGTTWSKERFDFRMVSPGCGMHTSQIKIDRQTERKIDR